jgi:hypothetical protein
MEQINYFDLEWYNRDGLDFFTISNCLNPQEMDLLAETFGELHPQLQDSKFTASSQNSWGEPLNKAKGIFLHELLQIPKITNLIAEK